jgi:tripartite-type tricarboxylate transporter receptor subunit TctC
MTLFASEGIRNLPSEIREENMAWLLQRCALIASLIIALGLAPPVQAQSYPSKTVTIVVPIGAGTGMDVLARLYGEKLSAALGQPVVVENRPGAATMLAATQIASAPADGHTLVILTSGAMAINPALYKKINYDHINAFVPISLYVKSPMILVVNPQLPIKTAAEFVKHAKEAKTPISYATLGAGAIQHLCMEYAKNQFGFNATMVPYKNTGQSVTDIASGQVDSGWVEAGASIPLIKDGRLRALAVSAGTRLPLLPDVPPFAEAANKPGFEAVSWHVLFAPAKTPKPIVDRLYNEMKKIMSDPDMKQRAANIGLIPIDSPSVEGMQDYIKAEREKWGSLVEQLGLKGSL